MQFIILNSFSDFERKMNSVNAYITWLFYPMLGVLHMVRYHYNSAEYPKDEFENCGKKFGLNLSRTTECFGL